MVVIKPKDNGGNKTKVIVIMKPKKIVVIICRNGGNKTKGSRFYKQYLVLKKNFG